MKYRIITEGITFRIQQRRWFRWSDTFDAGYRSLPDALQALDLHRKQLDTQWRVAWVEPDPDGGPTFL